MASFAFHPSARRFRNSFLFSSKLRPALIALTLLFGCATGASLWRARAATTTQNSVAVTTVSAASFFGSPAPLAPDSIVAAFGTLLSNGTQGASTQPLPNTLQGTTVTVNGANAPLFFVSPNQVNFLVPAGLAAGDAEVVITSTAANGDQVISRGPVKIGATAPAIFTANSNGAGVPAALSGRVTAGGQFAYDSTPLVEPDPLRPGQFLPAPIDPGTDQLPAFLILFGTGLRNAAPGTVKAVMGGVEIPVTPVAAPGFTGLDQVNVQLPPSLRGRGIIDLNLVAAGSASNMVTVNIAGNASAIMQVTGFSTTDPALVGQTVMINGSGFMPTAEENIVRFGAAQARVVSATGNQLAVVVPFGAESARVLVQTPQGEARSTATFRVRTSISGFVQSTGTSTTPPAPLNGVTVRVLGTNITAQTNPQGTFVIPDLVAGIESVEIDGGTTGNNPPFPRHTLKATIRSDRDSPLPQVSLQQISGGSGSVGNLTVDPTDALKRADGIDATARFNQLRRSFAGAVNLVAQSKQSVAEPQQALPTKATIITSGGVTLEVPFGTSARFPDGKTSGQLQLTVLQGNRLPGITLPIGLQAATIAQITPLGTTLMPGASITFPNPDQTNLGPSAKVDLYRYDTNSGAFIKRGTGTVSADRTKVVSDGRVVDVASFWFAAAPTGTANVTTVIGRVVDTSGAGVANAQVTAGGRSTKTDQSGSFTLPEVGTAGITQIQVEASLPQQYGITPRALSQPKTVVPGGITNVGLITLENTKQAGLVLSPFSIKFDSTAGTAKMDVTLTQPAPAGGLAVTITNSNTAVVLAPTSVTIQPGQTTTSFNLTRVNAGVALITATAKLNNATLSTVAVVTVSRPAPVLTAVTPNAAPPGAKITINGSGLSARPDGNIVVFARNGLPVAILDPKQNEISTDAATRGGVRVTVPNIPPGPVNITIATIDGLTGVISDPSRPISFTVQVADVTTPKLESVTPAQGKPRDQVTINGSGFSTTLTENKVVFRQGNVESEARVLKASATQLTVEVPSAFINQGAATIIVRRVLANGGMGPASNALAFTITADPQPPPKPVLTAAVNLATNQASGKDGTTIRITGRDLGRNFLNPRTLELANDEPIISLVLFYQSGKLINFAIPMAAANGTQIDVVAPTGFTAGQTQITVVNFDNESGLLSDESNALTFNITASSLRTIDEDEPNDSPDIATDVTIPIIVIGTANRTDPGDLSIRFTDGTSETLSDLFALRLEKAQTFSVTLSFFQTADLDLYILKSDGKGGYSVVFSSTRRQSIFEGFSGTFDPGDYLVAVGSYTGSSSYILTLLEGAVPNVAATTDGDGPNAKASLAVERALKEEH